MSGSRGDCFLANCRLHSGIPEEQPPPWPPAPVPMESGYVVRRPDAPTMICWQATDRESLESVAEELNAPIEKIGRSNLFRVTVQANDYHAWTFPQKLQELIKR